MNFDLQAAIAAQEKLITNLQQQAASKPELATQLRDAIEGLQRLKQMADAPKEITVEPPTTSLPSYWGGYQVR